MFCFPKSRIKENGGNFAVLRKFCIFTHFNFSFLSETIATHTRRLGDSCRTTVRMEACTKNVEATERFKQEVEQHCKEPVNGQFEDCTKEVLPGDGKQQC